MYQSPSWWLKMMSGKKKIFSALCAVSQLPKKSAMATPPLKNFRQLYFSLPTWWPLGPCRSCSFFSLTHRTVTAHHLGTRSKLHSLWAVMKFKGHSHGPEFWITSAIMASESAKDKLCQNAMWHFVHTPTIWRGRSLLPPSTIALFIWGLGTTISMPRESN